MINFCLGIILGLLIGLVWHLALTFNWHFHSRNHIGKPKVIITSVTNIS